MRDVTMDNFGLMIAYLLPGLTVLWGLSYHVEAIRVWLASSPEAQPTVAGFLYLTFGAIAAGMAASTARWAVIDTIHHATGVQRPDWNYSKLQENDLLPVSCSMRNVRFLVILHFSKEDWIDETEALFRRADCVCFAAA